jgi:hypothetical protein
MHKRDRFCVSIIRYALPRLLSVWLPIQAILKQTRILQAILAIQQLDEHDIEGIHPLKEHAAFHLDSESTDFCSFGVPALLRQGPLSAGDECSWCGMMHAAAVA